MLNGAAPAGWVGELRSMPRATDDAIKYAERNWPQARPEDFERDGRRFVERATGIEYDLVHGNPLLDDDAEVADVFIVEDGSLWFLRRPAGHPARWNPGGYSLAAVAGAGQLTPVPPMPQ